MAPSWSELSPNQKLVYFIESLAKPQDQQTPIACSLCDQIFFDNRSLVNHFQSHFNQDGTSNPRPHAESSVSRENVTEFFSRSSHSLSVPVNVRATANENLGARARQNISSNPPNLLQGNHLVGARAQNSLQFRGPTLTHRPQPYPSPSIFRSARSNGAFVSQPNQSSNFHSRFGSQPTGPQNSRFPLRPMNPGTSASQTTQPSNFHLPMNPGRSASQATQVANFHFFINRVTSTSQPIQQSSLCSPIPGSSGLAAPFIPGSSGLAAPSILGTSGLAAPSILGTSGLAAPSIPDTSGLAAPSIPGTSDLAATSTPGTSGFAAPSIPGTSGLAAPSILDTSGLAAPSTPDTSGLAATSIPDTSGLAATSIPGTSGLAAPSIQDTSGLAAPSIPGTSGLAHGTTKIPPQKATENEVEGTSTGYTKQYIMQLDQHIAGTVDSNNDVGGDTNPDALDLTLKL